MVKIVLELFCGTGSVGEALKKKGYEVISLDITSYKNYPQPTHQGDILEFDYKQYPKGHFDIIWASPPCTYYSIMQTCNLGKSITQPTGEKEISTKETIERNRNISDTWVAKTLEIIDYFKPDLWFIENPQSSNLVKRDVMKGIYNVVVDYCRYSDWGYRKSTRIWTNNKEFVPKRCEKKCGQMIEIEGKLYHKNNIGRFETRKMLKEYYIKHKMEKELRMLTMTKLDRYRIPERLVYELIE